MKILFFLLISIVFPILDNEDMNAIINHPTQTHWYDLPRAHQKGTRVPQKPAISGGLLSSYYNIAGSLDRFGNGNREFPWDKPGGLLSSENSGKGKRFIYLPKPVVWYKKDTLVRWIFPPGTIVGESLVLRTGDGQELPYQVRIREKVGNHWIFSVFQPFDSVESLSMALERSIVVNIEAHVVSGTKFKDFVEILPEIPETPKLLTTTVFKESSVGFVWTPDTKSDLCIVPKNNMMFITNTSCVICHKNTSLHVDHFPPLSRDWYGHIRGDDQIFSWYPFNPSCISYNGFSLPIIFDTKYSLEKYNPRVHTDYIQTGGFK